MARPKALDLFCGAGGASMGLHRAGFDVTGIDIRPQPRYPFAFIQADALAPPVDLRDFDFIWASPPCQRFSTMTKKWGREDEHPDLIESIRARLLATGRHFCIENVPNAPIRNDCTLCGSMFGLPLRRHRKFEASYALPMTPPCDHTGRVVHVYGHAGGRSVRDGISFGGTAEWRVAMGIDWMVGKELAEAIPPAYSEFIGRAALAHIDQRLVAA